MGADEVKGQLISHGKQLPLRPARRGRATGLGRPERHTRVEETEHESRASEHNNLLGPCSETRVVVLPVEPYMVHVYWEVNPDDLDMLKHRLGDEYRSSTAILRFYDVTNIIFDGTNAHSSFDVTSSLESKSSYVYLWAPEKSYTVELRFGTKHGRSFPLAQSKTIETPRAWPVRETDESYTLTEQDADGSLTSTEVPEEPFHGGEPVQSKADAELDLTEVNEQRFVSGLSSEHVSSPQS